MEAGFAFRRLAAGLCKTRVVRLPDGALTQLPPTHSIDIRPRFGYKTREGNRPWTSTN